MILGHVRDNFPRVILSLPGLQGPINVEFILDTGFEGELAVPSGLLRELDVAFVANRDVLLADGTERSTPRIEVILE